METIVKPWFALIVVVLLVETIFASAFATADAIGVTSPTTTSYTNSYSTGYNSYSSSSGFANSPSSSSYVNYQSTPNYQTYYSGSQVSTYWPILGDAQTCQNRQDIMLHVAPFGCQPVVVRSDLLEEQNVPIFCQLDALKINPLLDIDQIRSINFAGNYPPEILDVGFHPAMAALRTHDQLLGSPSINNVGYVVVVLKRTPKESDMPESVNVTLNARIDYLAGNALGIGRAEFILKPVSETDWNNEKVKQSFWSGRYFVKLEDANPNYATVSIYYGDRKVITTRIDRGTTSRAVYVPGMYCNAGLQIAYDGFTDANKKAQIQIASSTGTDTFDVYEGSRFLDDRCYVSRIDIDQNGETGNVSGSCGNARFDLSLQPRGSQLFDAFVVNGVIKEPEFSNGKYQVDLRENKDSSKKGLYVLDESNRLLTFGSDGKEVVFVDSSGLSNDIIINNEKKSKEWVRKVYDSLLQYKNKRTIDSTYSIGNIIDKKNSPDTFAKVSGAISAYEKVADDYPSEREIDSNIANRYGEEALKRAISLAGDFGMDSTKARLINKYLKIYPDGSSAVTYSSNLNSLYKIDSSLSGTLIEFEDKPRTISLLSVSQPTQIANADILIENQAAVNLRVDQSINLTKGGSSIGQINLDRLNVDEAQVSATCVVNTQGQLSGITRYLLHPDGSGVQICGLSVVLRKSNSEQVAKIRIIPQAEGTTTQTNFSIGIGIEKRAIKLSPDKTQDRINELNKTIEKWESISNSLGKVVSGLKAACFATAGILTFKNFLSGMSGETIARQQVMGGENGWRNMCKNMTGADRQYAKLDECYLANAGKIDADVQKISSNIGKINDKITSIQSKYVKSSDIFGQSIDSTAAKADVAKYARDTYGDTVIDTSTLRVPITDENGKRVDKITVADLLSEDNVNKGYVSNDMLRSAMLYGEAQKSGGLSAGESQNLNSNIIDVERQVYQNRIIARDVQNNEKSRSNGIPPVFYSGRDPASMRTAVVSPLNSDLRTKLGFTDPNVKYIASVRADGTMVKGANGQDSVGLPSGVYILGLTGGDGGVYSVKEVSQQTGDSYKVVSDSVAKSSLVNTIGNIRSADRVSYIHEIVPADRVVRYYETEPYKGMPAVVPFDVKQGWYAATKQTLPAFGGIGAFDASGKVSSFWLCNVGENGRVDFESSGFGDDTCQRIDTTTGQPAAFSGLSQNEAERRKNQATQAIDEAARQYGKGLKYVNIMGERMEVGNPSTGTPGTQCQDFMSPKDCFILFNVCDPVICPSSRCDFGGTYPVADVVQTGIVGSVLLCLPNIKEGIIVPVCLTGIKAGIDSLISIIKNYRDCLEENLKTGQMVGICDEIYSIYLCEFFWRQVAPLLNVLIPKLIESSYGQGTRGGGEYLTVNAAWQNMGNSIDYFTQSYAVNSIKAFQVRNIDEVGGQFCKAFISAKSPTAFKSLIEPDSPPQFYAWFDAAPYTSATVPATSQYKVFYHIFSGNDQGVQFSVYLRNPPQSSYYATPYYVQVATGFVPKGQYKSETRDFTAPQGYKELCVRINEDEQCGFKQVSTDFAINYLKDQYVANQLTNTNIGSEKECIGGSADIGAVLTNPNLQGGVQEAGAPAIYNRGIVRICGTSNPGLSTNPQRFVDVGQCDDPKVRCWLDKNSVSNAITSNNIGLQNATLQQLENRTMDVLQQNGQIFTPEDAAGELNSLRRAIGDLATSQNKQTDAQAILNRITLVQDKFYLNYHRAWLLLLKGEVLEIIARGAYRMEVAQKQQTSQSTVGGSGILSQYGVSPYMDLEGRVKADFGGSIGSYGVNQGGQLEWYDLNANPAGWTSVEYKLSSSDSSTTQAQKQWLIQLKQELTTARDKINSGSSGTVISQPATSVFSNIISVGDVESFGGNVRFISMNGIKTRVFFEKSSDSDLTIEGQLKVKNLLGTQNSASDTVILNTFKTIDSSDKSLILKSDLDDKVISESNFNSELWGVRTIDRWMIHQRSIISDDDYKVLTEMASQNIKYSVVGGDWLKRGNAANGVSNNGGTTTQPVSQPSSQSAIKYYSLDVGDTLDRNIRFGGAKTGIYIDYNSGSNGPFVMYVEDINGPVGLIHDTSAQIQITNFDSVDSITKGYLNDLNGKQYQLLLDGKIKEGVVVDDNQAPGGVVVPGSLGS